MTGKQKETYHAWMRAEASGYRCAAHNDLAKLQQAYAQGKLCVRQVDSWPYGQELAYSLGLECVEGVRGCVHKCECPGCVAGRIGWRASMERAKLMCQEENDMA